MPKRCALTLLVLSFFPHKNVSRHKLLTLVGGETASDQGKNAQPNGFEDDVGVPRVAKVWPTRMSTSAIEKNERHRTYEVLGAWQG